MEFLLSGAVNYIAVAAVTLGSIVLGFLWYGPLFGKRWMKEAGWTDEAKAATQGKSMLPTYFLMLLGTLLTTLIVSIFINYTDVVDARGGALTGLYLWLLILPVQMGAVLWERKSWTYLLINTTYNLITIVGSAVVLTLWV